MLVGFRVPYWDEAVEFVKALALVLPDTHYCGWDIAITEDGPLMIEGNSRGQFVWQYPILIGIREKLSSVIEEITGQKN